MEKTDGGGKYEDWFEEGGCLQSNEMEKRSEENSHEDKPATSVDGEQTGKWMMMMMWIYFSVYMNMFSIKR